ncbi:hypothetical protein PR048_027889 [Dryococelus australis]|uniref:C2H2-type domain-containing protein n=1 Tax=Dryococelus australis TaxID=614101 RepID=A0ABQ9GHS1_9NEOP|nr:hypothetical protein PR048_027889 [Dryococelus australis]
MAYSGVQQTRNQQNQNCCIECDMKFDTEKSLNVHLQYHQKNLMNKWGGKPSTGGDESNNNSHKTGNNNARVRGGDFSSPVMAPADSSDSMVKTEVQTSGAPGRPSSSSSTTYSRGSPPASTSFTYPPTPGSYNSAPSPYQSENHRYSPAGAHQPGYSFTSASRSEQTPPPMLPQNSVQNNFQGLVGPSLSFSSQDQPRHTVDENAHFFASGQHVKEEPGYIFGIGSDFPMLSPNARSSTPSSVPNSTPSSTSMTPTSSALRYHPYQHIAVSHSSQQNSYIQSNLSRDLVTTSRYAPSPQNSLQCEKCGFQCSSSSVLLDHINIAHRTVPMLSNHQVFMQQQNHALFSHRHDASFPPHQNLQRSSQEAMQGMFADFRDPGGTNNSNNIAGIQPKVEDETPAEILDLDSHKVHVYQPPPEEEEEALRAAAEAEDDGRSVTQNPHSVSAMLWGNGASPSNLHRSYRPMNVVGAPEFASVPTSLSPPTPVTSDVTVPQPTTYQPHRTYLSNPDDIHSNPNMPRVSPTHQTMITSTQLPHTNAVSSTLPSANATPQTQNQQKGSKGDQSWKSNEARRPKTYNCSACNKWFTSSGHLKRHYNTTLHKNAVKQSGVPDPATVPVSQHHHPNREGGSGPIMHRRTPVPGGTGDSSSPAPSLGGEDSSRSDDAGQTNAFGRMTPQQPASSSMLSSSNSQIPESPPNRLAGPSAEISGGLQYLSTYNSTQEVSSVRSSLEALPPHVTPQHLMLNTVSPPVQSLVPQSALGSHLIHHPIPQQPRHLNPSMTAFPNGLPPHVSTTQTPISTNQHHLTTSIGSQAGSPALANVASIDDVPNHLLLGSNAGTMTSLFPSSTSNYHPLPSFSQLHQNHLLSSNSGNTLTLLQGFNGMSQYHHPTSGYHLVSTLENVGGLSLSPNSQILMDIHSLANADNNINNYLSLSLEDSEIDLKSDDVDSKISSSEKNVHGLSDSNGSVGDNISILSPIGTPDYPTSTTEDLEQDVIKLSFSADDLKPVSAANGETGHKVNDSGFVTSVSNSTLPKCVACDKVFNKACYLTQHNKSFHSGHKPFKCPRCGKRFDTEIMYQEHQGKHAGDKPFKCEICPKQFNHKTDLRRHLCLHTGEKPYSCDTCGKGFIRKDHMLKHTETHRRRHYNNNNNIKNKNIDNDELSSQIVTSNEMELEQLAISGNTKTMLLVA